MSNRSHGRGRFCDEFEHPEGDRRVDARSPGDLVGIVIGSAAGAAFLYDLLANPRVEEYPIKEVVTQPDPGQPSTATAQ